MNLDSIRNVYRRHSKYYDAVFGPVLHPGRRKVAQSLCLRPGDKVLEVGVGTGLSLSLYPKQVQVTGIDISREMLDIARQRAEQDQLVQVVELSEMDAEAMSFPDTHFDKVVAMYVMSVVPNPLRVLDEMRRVCKPAGEIFIVNHFHSRHPLLRILENMFSPFSKLAGFRPDLDMDGFVRDTELDVIEELSTNLLGYWKILRCHPARATLLSGARSTDLISTPQ